MTSGWRNDGELDKATEAAVAILMSQINTTGKCKRITRMKKQAANGVNDDITPELDNDTS